MTRHAHKHPVLSLKRFRRNFHRILALCWISMLSVGLGACSQDKKSNAVQTEIRKEQPEQKTRTTSSRAESEPALSQSEQAINDLIKGDVWQVSLAKDPYATYDNLIEFLRFNADGSVFCSFFDGQAQSVMYTLSQVENDSNALSGRLTLDNLELNGTAHNGITMDLWLSYGKNLDKTALVDYSSLLLTFEDPQYNEMTYQDSGQLLLTTSGLSLDEANQIAFAKEQEKETVESVYIPYSEAVQICWDFFINKGLSKEQTAGILGNIKEESDFNFQVYSSSGTYFGLFQLSSQRQAAMFEMGGDTSIYKQLEYIWLENFTTDHPYSNKNYMALQNNTFGSDYRGGCIDFNEPGHTVEEYAIAWMMNVERCWTPQTDWQKPAERAASARGYYDLLA